MPGMNLSCCHGDITIAYRYFMSTPENKLAEEEANIEAAKKMVTLFPLKCLFWIRYLIEKGFYLRTIGK